MKIMGFVKISFIFIPYQNDLVSMRITFLILSCAFLCVSLAAQPQTSSVREKAILLKRMIELNHYSPRPVDDSFSVAVFKTVMNAADPKRLLFTTTEYTQLSGYRTNWLRGAPL
jgi:hypothetical protein